MVYGRLDPKTEWDIWTCHESNRTGEDRTPLVYLQTEFNEHQARLSPDGRWMAYRPIVGTV